MVKAPVPAQNLHAMQTPDMVIVTTPLFADCAKELAEIHISRQGLDVAVIMQEDIFNEFSSGNNHPSGSAPIPPNCWTTGLGQT